MLAQTKQHVRFVFCKFQSMFMGLSQFNYSSTKWEDGVFVRLYCKVGDQRWKTACISSFPVSVIKHPDRGNLREQWSSLGSQFKGTVHHAGKSWQHTRVWIAGYIRVMVKKQNKMNAVLSCSLYVIQPRIPHSGNRLVHCHLMSSR